MKSLFIVNDPPYGTERVYNALRLAQALLKRDPTMQLTVFLMADAVVAAKVHQKTPDGYYNVERQLCAVCSERVEDNRVRKRQTRNRRAVTRQTAISDRHPDHGDP
jgi:uncharacterized protein involved in oxidation of intracellular sulfur